MSYINTYHPEWQQSRIRFIIGKFGNEYFKDKSVLELAPFNGYIGNCFYELGAKVTCVEGREENVKNIKTNFPNLIVHTNNLDTPEWTWGKFDIIINWGLLYHLENNHEKVLENCIKNSDLLLLESVICGDDKEIISYVNEIGIDQSISNKGGRPSIKWVESILQKYNCKFELCTSAALNAGLHIYTGEGTPNYDRRMWIIYNQ